jgi:hypothetical protein
MIFTRFQDTDATVVKTNEVTFGMFSPNDTGSLNAMFTSSAQVGVSGMYYYDVYHATAPTAGTGEVQFSIAYGHVDGGGSPSPALLPNSLIPSKVIYSQYKNMLLDSSATRFTFNNESNDIYVINFNRSRMKQSLNPGNWSFALSGSNGVIAFADNSNLGNALSGNVLSSKVYDVVQVQPANRTQRVEDNTIYGKVFTDNGIIVLNPTAIANTVGFVRNSAGTEFGYPGNQNIRFQTTLPFAPYTEIVSIPPFGNQLQYQYQHEGLYRSLKLATDGGHKFIASSAEKITSRNYFVRVPYNKYNYTTNPSYYNSTSKQPLPAFQGKPVTYVTTVGLYNDINELLAVAKLSRPLQKNDERELLIRVRLDY